MFYPDEKVELFIDGQSAHTTCRALETNVDWRRFKDYFAARCRLIRANYYTTVIEDPDEVDTLRPLVDWLDYNGYAVVTKPRREYTDANGNRRWRGSMLVDMAVDAVLTARRVDHIVLFAADSDFTPVVRAIQGEGVRVTVISTLHTSPAIVQDDLRRQADVYLDLKDMLPDVARAAVALVTRERAVAGAR